MMYQFHNTKNVSWGERIVSAATGIFNLQKIELEYPAGNVVGIRKETKPGENRVALTPVGLNKLTLEEPNALYQIEKDAGIGSGYTNDDYLKSAPAGRVKIVEDKRELFETSDIIWQFKESTLLDIGYFNRPKVVFGYGHFASNKDLVTKVLGTNSIFLTYETAKKNGRNILLEPMSTIAGEISIDLALDFFHLQDLTGKNVAIFGGLGVAGSAAAFKLLNQDIFNLVIFEPSDVIKMKRKLKQFASLYNDPRVTLLDPEYATFEKLKYMDVIIGAAYRYGQKPPIALSERISRALSEGKHPILVVDIAIDQGGSTFYTSTHPAQHHGDDPGRMGKNLFHISIANMPSLAKQRASLAQEQVNLPYFLKLLQLGKNFTQDEVLSSALNFATGHTVLKGLAEELSLPYTPLKKIKFIDSNQ